jgi:hypothetical protein
MRPATRTQKEQNMTKKALGAAAIGLCVAAAACEGTIARVTIVAEAASDETA